jgi:CubicO group peptidase (beta-lactamase class C family)
LPSVVAGVARGGEQVWWGAGGSHPEPDAGTAYRIGSITKTMTAVLVLQLRDEGLLSLDDPVGRWVPETGYADATVRELLSHAGGLPSEPVGPWWERSPGVALDALLAADTGGRRVAPAREFWHYSNLGYALLGAVAERLAGRSWWELVQERLLTPLGLAHTTYDAPPGAAPGSSIDHFAGTLTAEPATDTRAMAPAGQLWSTAGDLLVWADFLATGHPDVLAAATLAEMREPVLAGSEYGLGLRTIVVGERTFVGHTGSMPGFQASLFVDPAARDAVAVLANATTGLESDQVLELFLGERPVPPVEEVWVPTPAVPDDAAPLLGAWFWGNTALGFEWRALQDGRGRLEVRSLRTGALEDAFERRDGVWIGVSGYHRGERLDVVRRADGSVGHLECATFVYTRTPYDPDAPIPGGVPRSG